MAKNYIGKGSRIVIPANVIGGPVSAGDLFIANNLVGVLLHDGQTNDPNVMKIDGEWSFPKDTGAGTGGALGVNAYVTPGGAVTALVAGNTLIGVFSVASADGDATAIVRLNAVGTA